MRRWGLRAAGEGFVTTRPESTGDRTEQPRAALEAKEQHVAAALAPSTLTEGQSSQTSPSPGTRQCVVLRPTTPQRLDGRRMDPPPSALRPSAVTRGVRPPAQTFPGARNCGAKRTVEAGRTRRDAPERHREQPRCDRRSAAAAAAARHVPEVVGVPALPGDVVVPLHAQADL